MLNVGREDESKEFKESTVELEKGLVSLTAMLNKHCKGEVLFGVKDNGDVIGQDIGKNTLRSITQSVSNFIDPHITPTVTVLTAEDGKKYISLTAEAHDRPYLFKGTAYIRSGEEDRKALHSDLRRMLLSSGDMLMETESKNQDLRFDELFDLFKSHGLTVNKTRSFYNSIGLLNHEGRFNIQAEILSDQNIHPLTVAIFNGNDKTSLLMRRDFSGHSLLLEVKSVLDYVETMNEKFVDVTGPARKETDLFDYPAFREAWVNACVHNNWIGQIPPSIYIFDDRIEILSYGDKPYWLSDEGFFGGESMPVNESLMRTFISVGLSEHTGHGVPVVTRAYGEAAYEFTGGSVKVTLTFPRKRGASRYRDSTLPSLKENEALVLEAIKAHPNFTLDEIAELTGLGRSTVGKIVPSLRKAGILKRKGSKRDGEWAVNENRL